MTGLDVLFGIGLVMIFGGGFLSGYWLGHRGASKKYTTIAEKHHG